MGGGSAADTVRQHAHRAEQHIVLLRVVRRAARTRPGRSAVIMTLGAEVDVRIVFVSERVRSGQNEVIGRGQRLAKVVGVNVAGYFIRPDVFLVRVMASGTGNTHRARFVSGGQGTILNQRLPHGPGVAATATRDESKAVREVFFQFIQHGPMSRGIPLFVIGTM